MKLVNKQHVFLNSSNRVSGSSSDFLVNLDQNYFNVGLDDPSVLYKIYISSFVCMNDFDVVSDYTNSFSINGTVVHLSNGKPNVYDLVQNINQFLLPLVGASCFYNSVDNRLVFQTDTPFVLDFRLSNSAYQVMGFNLDRFVITDGFVSPQQVNVDTSFDLLYIKSSFGNNLELTGVASVPSRILSSVPIITAPHSKIVYEDSGVYSTFIPSLKWLQNLRLSITDYDSIPLVLQGNVFMTLTIETLIDDTALIMKELQVIQKELSSLKEISSLGVLGQSLKPYAKLQNII
jgi:hypothetical protein